MTTRSKLDGWQSWLPKFSNIGLVQSNQDQCYSKFMLFVYFVYVHLCSCFSKCECAAGINAAQSDHIGKIDACSIFSLKCDWNDFDIWVAYWGHRVWSLRWKYEEWLPLTVCSLRASLSEWLTKILIQLKYRLIIDHTYLISSHQYHQNTRTTTTTDLVFQAALILSSLDLEARLKSLWTTMRLCWQVDKSLTKARVRVTKHMNFWTSSKGRGSFSIQKSIFQILDL